MPWLKKSSQVAAFAALLHMRSKRPFFGLHTAIVNAAARPPERDTPQTCMLRPSDFNGLPVKISLHGSILLQRRVSQPHFVAIVARRFLITRAAGERWLSRPVRSIFSRRYCLKRASFGIRARHGHVHPTTYLDSPSIRNGGDRVPPNHSLNRTRVRRASFGARRHGPVSLVR